MATSEFIKYNFNW